MGVPLDRSVRKLLLSFHCLLILLCMTLFPNYLSRDAYLRSGRKEECKQANDDERRDR